MRLRRTCGFGGSCGQTATRRGDLSLICFLLLNPLNPDNMEGGTKDWCQTQVSGGYLRELRKSSLNAFRFSSRFEKRLLNLQPHHRLPYPLFQWVFLTVRVCVENSFAKFQESQNNQQNHCFLKAAIPAPWLWCGKSNCRGETYFGVRVRLILNLTS